MRIAPLLLVSMLLLIESALNAADTNQNYVTPDLRAWNQVKKGLPVAELVELLGQPIRRSDPHGDYKPGDVYCWTYGYVAKQSEVFPEDLKFVVKIEMGKVWSKEDPFGGVPVSTNGWPTVPKLMSPPDAAVFSHYPRFVDFRWYASSGDYPMEYEIEIDTQYPSGEWSHGSGLRKVSFPYTSYSHGGLNRGRWRVRAVNSKGKSQWSDYSYFKFNV